MHRLVLQRCNYISPRTIAGTAFIRRSAVTKSLPLAAIERQEQLRDSQNDLIRTAITRSQNEASQSPPISLLDSPGVFEIPEVSVKPETTGGDKAPLPFEDIPGPAVLKILEKYWRYVPIFGQLSWNRNIVPLKYLFNEYGPIVRIHGPISGDVVMIHRPEHIAEVFKQEGVAPVRSGIDVLQHYRLHHKKYSLPGPFNMQGPEWTRLKEKLEKPFADQIGRYFEKLEIACDDVVRRIRKIRNRQYEVPDDFGQDLSRWGMESFSVLMLDKRMGFLEPSGLDGTSEASRIIEALTLAHHYLSRCETGFQFWRFFDTPFAKKLFAACDVIDGVIGKYIRQAQNKLGTRTGDENQSDSVDDDSSPLIEKLLLSQAMQPDDISTVMMDMIILGVQATTNSEAFLLYYLARNPRVQRRVYEEVCAAMPGRETSLTQQDLKGMKYLRACMNECHRLRPAFPFITRALPQTVTLHGYTIPKGTYVIMANQISSLREENFEDPEKFKPERWLQSNNVEFVRHQRFSCLPFGHGIRSCLGKEMAETEMALLTAKLIREFRIEYDYADIGSKYMMVNVPDRPLRFRFVDRD